MTDQLVTAAEAALAAGVSAATVRDWKRRDLLEPAGRDRRHRPLYRITDVWDVERRTRRATRGRPRNLAS